MLISLTLQNCRSFADPVTFSLVKGRCKQHPDHVIEGDDGLDVLPVALVFGANAAGKSNLINTVRDAKQIITESKPLAACYVPFKLDTKLSSSPTKFEFTFRASGSVFQYIIEFNASLVIQERLAVLPNDESDDIVLFSREGEKFELAGLELSGDQLEFASFVARITPNNKLFLTELSERDLFDKIHATKLKSAFDWFKNTLVTRDSQQIQSSLPKRLSEDSKFCARVSDAVSSIDVGIKRLGSTNRELNEIPDLVNSIFAAGLAEFGMPGTYFEKQEEKVLVHTTHAVREDRQGEEIRFNLKEESSGTRRFIHLIPALAECQDEPRVFFVDELDNNLHPLLTKSFVQNFLSNGAQSQMIATTHESTLLDSGLVRRDEIWLLEKQSDGSSELKSVEEYKIRPDLDIKRAYLGGRFGGIPLVQDATWIVENVETERQV